MLVESMDYGGLIPGAADIYGTDEEESGEVIHQFLTFSVAGGEYGIDILDTHEILKPVVVTRLPNVESDVLGVINLRGNIIPIIDLNQKFRGAFSALELQSRIVVVFYKGKYTGLLVDRVLEVAQVPESGLESAGVRGLSNEYIQGVGRSDQRLFLILNLDILTNLEVAETL
ncbi:MAG: chemotaxis protein CheW [Leptospirales bacterium]